MNENDEEIDDLQADFNEVEMRLNDAALKISLGAIRSENDE